jgi:hypothetical protein
MATGLPALPRRDREARARLEVVGGQARPATLAHERTLAVPGELGSLLPGGVTRGATITVDGAVGAGATSLVFELAAAVTAVGEWAAVVDVDCSSFSSSRGMVGAEAAGTAGVALERFAVIRRVPLDRWSTVVAALLDGMSLVITDVPRAVSLGDARRLVARARERGAVLVLTSSFPSSLSIHANGGRWLGLTQGGGVLARRERVVEIEAHGISVPSPATEIADVG